MSVSREPDPLAGHPQHALAHASGIVAQLARWATTVVAISWINGAFSSISASYVRAFSSAMLTWLASARRNSTSPAP